MKARPVVGTRQFLLSKEESDSPPGYQHVPLASGHLYSCPTLPLHVTEGPAGRRRVLLGVAAVVDGSADDGDPPEVQLRQLGSGELEDRMRGWSGRWVLIDGDEVHLDATGMLPLHVQAAHARVSSSPALLVGQPTSTHKLHQDAIMPWYPGPETGIEGVTRVLPSQVLHLWDLGTRPVRLPHPAPLGDAEIEGALEEIGRQLVTAVRAAARIGPTVVPLTGGHDSRLVLAACLAAGIDTRTVTQGYPEMSKADRSLPPAMAAAVGVPHAFVPPHRRDATAALRYDNQVGGLAAETDRRFFAHGQFDWLRPGDVLLRGVCLDGGRAALNERFRGVPLDANAIAQVFGASAAQERGLQVWVRGVLDDPQPVNLHDRFWWEQKCASYASMSEVALDLTGAHSVLPGNATRFQELMHSFPYELRRISWHSEELVRRWAPALAQFPYNPPESKWRPHRVLAAARRRARVVAARLR